MAEIKSMPEMTLKEFQSKGGKNRWRGKSAQERTDEMRRVAKERWKKKVSAVKATVAALLLFTFSVCAQSTCSHATDGRIIMRPKYTCSECVLETSTSAAGPWFITNHVWGERPCAEISFTIPKTNERLRLWRLRILK